MTKKIPVKIILPSALVLDMEADMVNIPGTAGMFGVLPGHAKFASNIKVGIVTIFTNNKQLNYFVYGGVAQVTGERLNIVTEFAVDLNSTSKSTINSDILLLQDRLRSQKSEGEDSGIEVRVLEHKIKRLETMLQHIGTKG